MRWISSAPLARGFLITEFYPLSLILFGKNCRRVFRTWNLWEHHRFYGLGCCRGWFTSLTCLGWVWFGIATGSCSLGVFVFMGFCTGETINFLNEKILIKIFLNYHKLIFIRNRRLKGKQYLVSWLGGSLEVLSDCCELLTSFLALGSRFLSTFELLPLFEVIVFWLLVEFESLVFWEELGVGVSRVPWRFRFSAGAPLDDLGCCNSFDYKFRNETGFC